MTESNQLTWEKLRRFFEVDNFGMPLPDWYGEIFDEFKEAELRKAKAEGWEEGHSWGWSDSQEAHDVRQSMDRADWRLNTPNPYREAGDDEQL